MDWFGCARATAIFTSFQWLFRFVALKGVTVDSICHSWDNWRHRMWKSGNETNSLPCFFISTTGESNELITYSSLLQQQCSWYSNIIALVCKMMTLRKVTWNCVSDISYQQKILLPRFLWRTWQSLRLLSDADLRCHAANLSLYIDFAGKMWHNLL